ncbi:flippase-like domain-containing protein [filamentous cyanobacterium LEGE 11480]|uniref:Flippase-like domain-containing protein n=1 Tax=Romeriopsis navalis LEGE 11480 TaxID=2777977 RepID=A0A928VQK1_9CYAN|nr:lysylphosphatidylglycerol synthase transmembrane domain-containing protein [Romeriopsis navalis]MBE9030279.1 flippase-like domain-containing protein [Romeriopsis navalis LEGE 11480]
MPETDHSVAQSAEKTPTNLRGSIRSLFLGLVVGAFFLTLAFRRTSWDSVLASIQAVNQVFILYGIGVYALYLLMRAWRWSFLLSERTDRRPFAPLFRAVTWGTAANAVIPHSGELLRAFATRKHLSLSASSIIGSIAAERLYDFAAVILVTATTLFLMADAPPVLTDALVAITVMASVVLLPLIALAFENPLMVGLVNLLARLLPKQLGIKVVWQIQELSAGIRSAFSNSQLPIIFLLSIVQWLLIATCIYFSLVAFSLNLPFWVALVVLPLTLAGLTLPSAPAYLGTMQICFMAGLMPFGVTDETAIAASMVYLSIVAVPVMLASIIWYLIYVALYRRTL